MNAPPPLVGPPTLDDVRRFAFRQGPGKGHLGEQHLVDDRTATTSALPPRRARSATGVPLPLGTHELLAAAPYPGPCGAGAVAALEPQERLGHLLTTAFGLQRREPSHRYADHRSVASGRAKYPVHAFLAQGGAVRYHDAYRHALVDVAPSGGVTAGPADGSSVLLAGRYSDLPAAYGRLRYAVAEVELGVALRSLCVAADLFGVPAALALDGAATARAEAVVRSAGPGTWSAPLVVRLDVPGPAVPGRALPGPPPPARDGRDPLLEADDPSARDAAAISAHRRGLPSGPPAPARGLPSGAPAGSSATGAVDWAQVLWNRTAGRMPDQLYGFALRPAEVSADCLADLLAWADRPPPGRLLAEVAERVRLSVALQRVGGLPVGVHQVEGRGLVLGPARPGIMATLQPGFAQQPAPNTDSGMRHAAMAFVHSVDVDALLDDFGPAAFGLLQLCLGWSVHGLCLAAAAHGLVARPARSFVEYRVQPLFGLRREETPVFMTVCGTSRFTEPMLDLRT
ncbi:hypothetical protein ACFC6L_11115 [Kitasatospora phosalacinea]|uniref:hypothetical protein n=1 Tax=Kitasatospora phosalacinea TaxID=2065 RepID=UPI0035E0700B